MDRLSNQLIKIADELEQINIDQKLFNCKTKQNAIRYIYKKVGHLTTGFFHDDNWSNVMKVFNAINALGCKFNWGVKDGGYHDVKNSYGEVTSKYKQYDLTISFINVQDKQIKINGQLIATGAGDTDDWFGRYDMALILS